MFLQSVPYGEILDARASQVLGLIAVLLVIGLVAFVTKSFVGKKPDDESLSDRVVRAIALIEHEGIDLPKNWREYVDARIQHKNANFRANLLAYAHLLERGQWAKVAKMLREEAEEE